MGNERRAFEGLVFQSLRKLEVDDVDVSSIREATAEEKETLEKIRDGGFLNRLMAGEITDKQEAELGGDNEPKGELLCAGSGESLFRSDGIDEETAQELEDADQRIIQRKLQEQVDDETC